MMNVVWVILIVIGLIVGALTGRMEEVSNGMLKAAVESVEMLWKLSGPLLLWLGFMKIAEKSRLTSLIARGIKPIMRRIFPDVPPEHPAMGAMAMNLSANMLGLGNTATPLGIKAMRELQKLNLHSERASKAMITFLVINTANITLLPGTLISARIATGSKEPTAIVGPTLIATLIAMAAALIVDRVCRWLAKD